MSNISSNVEDRVQVEEPSDNFPKTVEQLASPDETAVTQSQAEIRQPDLYQYRDLLAQEDMALWAMLMFFAAVATFVVTSAGTVLIWRQVKLTRQAVEDTGEATDAMKDANEIARATARPWVSIEIKMMSCTQKDGILAVEAGVTFKNLGQSAATNFNCGIAECYGGDSYSHDIHRIFDKIRDCRTKLDDSALLPGEAVFKRFSFMKPVEEMGFFKTDEDGEFLFFVVCAAAHYRSATGIPGGWLETARSFLLSRRDAAGFVWTTLPKGNMRLGSDRLLAENLGTELVT